eukprot:gene14480-30825_t
MPGAIQEAVNFHFLITFLTQRTSALRAPSWLRAATFSDFGYANNAVGLRMKLLKHLFLSLATLLVLPALAAPSDFLVTTDWLEKNLNDPKLRLIEVSVNPGVFERGHIPGAWNVQWHTDLVDPVRRDIASQQNFEQLLRKAGVSND